ncbi:chlorite dismutase family protein [Ramlibacter sp.]|uniref:chlorite dismutase family protein n=1 Tax=Ramlibacter sp. TaxID=1917967 RepID=UPI003D12E807
MQTPRLFHFSAGPLGPWHIEQVRAVRGDALPAAERLSVHTNATSLPGASWTLRGITSNERYVERAERVQLVSVQEGLGRPHATCAALIPIRKSAAWWQLTQDERRAIFEAQSRHTAIGLRYLPAIARRLHHCRDLGDSESFDFLTWFEFAPSEAPAFDELLAALRETPEWAFVEREVEVRLVRDDVGV